MTPESRWRLDIASELALVYATNPDIAAVFVGGSTARGHADRYSDIELGVLWTRDPTESERAALIHAAGADLHLVYEPEGIFWDDCFFVGRDSTGAPKTGQAVEVSHLRLSEVERLVASLSVEPESDDLTMNLLSGFADGIPLHGVDLMSDLADIVRSYPDPLARAVARRDGMIEFFWCWQMIVDRGNDRGPLLAQFWKVQQQVLQLLLAVNRRYPLGYKFLNSIMDRCLIGPQNLADRFASVSTLAPAAAAAELKSLVLDTYDLVEAHVPGLDTGEVDRWRHYFEYQRPFWASRPGG